MVTDDKPSIAELQQWMAQVGPEADPIAKATSAILEIAAAALAWAAADDALGGCTASTRFGLNAKAHQAWKDLRAALVKVRP